MHYQFCSAIEWEKRTWFYNSIRAHWTIGHGANAGFNTIKGGTSHTVVLLIVIYFGRQRYSQFCKKK